MTKLTRIIHNIETGEIVEQDLTAQELAQLEADKLKRDERIQFETDIANEKAALLTKLGITESEAALLLS